jgi:hypothetical protein
MFGAVPNHELLKTLVSKLTARVDAHPISPPNVRTGPYFMTEEAKAFLGEPTFAAFSTHVFFPYSWGEPDPGPPYNPLSFAVHHFKDAKRAAV